MFFSRLPNLSRDRLRFPVQRENSQIKRANIIGRVNKEKKNKHFEALNSTKLFPLSFGFDYSAMN